MCLSRDNQTAPWINYEAGALAKVMGLARVIPYTIGFPPGEVVPGPLSRFQGVENDEAGTWKLVQTLNRLLDTPKSDAFIHEAFELWWPRLRDKMAASTTTSSSDAREEPELNDLLMEVRNNVRQLLHMATAGTMDVGAAIQLLEDALRDPLTGLANRRAFASRSSELTARAVPYVIGLIDVDRFKEINDSFGHAAGDRVLSIIGTTLKEQLTRADLVARHGGTEFAAIFPNAAPVDAVAEIEGAAGVVARRSVEAGFTPVTLSAGVSLDRGGTEDKLRQADAAMYAAKSLGRNRVLISDA